MAIYFVCTCGQDLRADERESAGLIRCPSCCQLVPVPSLELANQALGIAAAAPLEVPARPERPAPAGGEPAKSQLPSPRRPAPAPPVIVLPLAGGDDEEGGPYRLEPSDGRDEDGGRRNDREQALRLLARARKQADARDADPWIWKREEYWFQCLMYPLRAWPLVFGLAFGWFLLTSLCLAVVPDEGQVVQFLPWLFVGLVGAVLFCYTCAFCGCVLLSARRGEAGFVAWPRADLGRILWSGLAGLVCLLVGPVVPLGAGFLFWLNSGDLDLVDWLILWELGTLAVLGWLLGMLAVLDSGRLRETGPGAAGLVWHLGWRVLGLALLGSAVAAGLAVLTLGLLESPAGDGGSWIFTAYCWAGESFWMIFVLRWLGLTCFWIRQKRSKRYVVVPQFWESSAPA